MGSAARDHPPELIMSEVKIKLRMRFESSSPARATFLVLFGRAKRINTAAELFITLVLFMSGHKKLKLDECIINEKTSKAILEVFIL